MPRISIGKLLSYLPHADIGWKEIEETFIRYTIIKTPWFRIYLHYLDCPIQHPECHDHPWNFIAIILKGGYFEQHNHTWTWRPPGSVLFRPAEWSHNVITWGTTPNWSLVITGSKRRDWGFKECN